MARRNMAARSGTIIMAGLAFRRSRRMSRDKAA
jgi:hypothetical protein